MYGPKWPLLPMYMSPDVDDWDRCFLGRAPRIRETLPDFSELCRVTRHSRVFRGLTGYQRTPGFWGVTNLDAFVILSHGPITQIKCSPNPKPVFFSDIH